jgi:phospholipase C
MQRFARPGLLALALPLLLTACSSSEPETPAEPPLPGPSEWNREVTPPTDAEAEANRASCEYEAGALPAETQGESTPSGKDIPIDHVLVLMMENRSFDHYFQKLPEYGQPDVDVAPPGFSNPDPNGMPVEPFHMSDYCFVDTAHGWGSVHEQVNDGKMDGFVTTNEMNHELPANGTLDMLSGKRAMGYYDQTDLPFYYWLASEFSIADRYFCSVQGPTWPNRMFLYAGTSFGLVRNTFPPDATTLPDYLTQRGVSWKVYVSTIAGLAMFASKISQYSQNFAEIPQYFADAAAGKLPQVAFVDPGMALDGVAGNDEHPPALAQAGQKFTAEVIDALTRSPVWSRSALFLTYDEHGGLYDHVVPPKACPPDDTAAVLEPGEAEGAFDELGVRVPMMVVSPYAKKHFVGHRTYDHTSIIRFIQARFRIPALTGRDANAEAPWEMFDFENPPHMTPPTIQIPTIDAAKLQACKAVFEN